MPTDATKSTFTMKPVQNLRQVNVLIASPVSDCQEYRLGMVSMMEYWNRTTGVAAGVRFQPKMFERDSVATQGEDGQSVINRQVVAECQAAVAFFHAKVGWENPPFASGTAEEIDLCTKMGIKISIFFWDGSDDTTVEGKRLAAYRDAIGKDKKNKYYYKKFSTVVDAVTMAMESIVDQANQLLGTNLVAITDTSQELVDSETNEGISFDDFYETRKVISEHLGMELRKFRERQDEGANQDLWFAINDIRSGWVLTNQTSQPISVHSYEVETITIDERYMGVSDPVVLINAIVVEPGDDLELEVDEYDEDALRRGRINVDYTIGNHRIEGTVDITLDSVTEEEAEYQAYMESHAHE